ncbi:hypothetical protein PLICRDRAFT_651971 [Plicaturopsis crispa FD-325 SS-3]|nr:hypothetical protein PLICRDRAFT_651971 [Plicaturopsis crispa FD-325 SS-3]
MSSGVLGARRFLTWSLIHCYSRRKSTLIGRMCSPSVERPRKVIPQAAFRLGCAPVETSTASQLLREAGLLNAPRVARPDFASPVGLFLSSRAGGLPSLWEGSATSLACTMPIISLSASSRARRLALIMQAHCTVHSSTPAEQQVPSSFLEPSSVITIGKSGGGESGGVNDSHRGA